MKRILRISMVLAATAMVTLGFSARAVAADHTMHTGDAFGGGIFGWYGKGWFNEHGDVVTICDADADGNAVMMNVYYDRPSGNPMYSFHVGGEGRCVTRKASMGGVYNLRENHYVGFKFCRYPDGECKDYRFYNDH